MSMNEIALKGAVVRFLRVIIPQIPAMVAFVQSTIDPATVPAFIGPLLVLLGATATALDKFCREVGFYGDVKEYLTGSR
jgi:hypothetical protein